MNIVLRAVEEHDAAIVFRHNVMANPASDAERLAFVSWLSKSLAEDGYIGVLAEVDGSVVAGVGARLLNWGPTRADPSPIRARVSNVFVEPAFRRQGIARNLMQELIARLSARGITTLSLATTDEGQALYENLGFTEAPRERVRFGKRSQSGV